MLPVVGRVHADLFEYERSVIEPDGVVVGVVVGYAGGYPRVGLRDGGRSLNADPEVEPDCSS